MGFFSRLSSNIKKKFSADYEIPGEIDDGYVEIDPESKSSRSKILVRPYVLEHFDDVKPILDDMREGYTIALVNIGPLKDKDLVELKRAINKMKKTCEAIDGDIAGFGDNWITIVPSFAVIHRESRVPKMPAQPAQQNYHQNMSSGKEDADEFERY